MPPAPADPVPLPARFDAGAVTFARHVLDAVQIAAAEQPELLRGVLAAVFDLAAVRRQAEHVSRMTLEQGAEARGVAHHLEDVGRAVAELERRIDAVDHEFDRLAVRLTKLNGFLDTIAAKVRHINGRQTA